MRKDKKENISENLLDSNDIGQFEFLSLGYQSLDSNGCFLDVNQEWLNTLGYKKEEVIGKWFGDFMIPEDSEILPKTFERFIADGLVHTEFRMIHKNGNILYIVFDGKIENDENNKFRRTHCTLKDVTIQKKLECKLKESHELLQSVINSATDAIFVKDSKGKYLLLNAQAEIFIGKNASEVLGKDDTFLFPINQAEAIMESDKKIFESKKALIVEEQDINNEGKEITNLTIKSPIFNDENVVKGIVGISRDITERKLAEQAIEESEEKYRLLYTSMNQGLALHEIILDEFGKPIDYVFLEINESYTKLLGVTREMCIGKRIREVMPKVEQYWIEEFGKVAINGEASYFENYLETTGRWYSTYTYSPKKNQFAVLVTDITDNKNKTEEITHLSYRDQLTGLYNRRFYEEELKRLDTERNIPITIVMGDINGLKLVNDSFGHNIGDELIKRVAESIKEGCRADDIIARIGGDEFVIILPKTDEAEAEKIIMRIKNFALNKKINALDISISFGYSTKKIKEQKMQDILKESEDYMYRHKLFESTSMRSKSIDLIMNTLYEKNRREMLHSKRVSNICEKIAIALNLSIDKVNQIRTAGLLHDIGKIGIDESILNSVGRLNADEWKEVMKHSEIGYRILSSANEFAEIAEFILEHHERWDGSGYPKGIKGLEIKRQARIITIADSFDAMTRERTYKDSLNLEEAISEIISCAGKQFDPDIAKVFVEKVIRELQ